MADSLEQVAAVENADPYGITSVDFSPDGSKVISGGASGTLKVWGFRPFVESEWEEVDISDMEKDEYGEVKVEGLGYISCNYWKNKITGDVEKQKPSAGKRH